ncbi:hypothetical protein B8V81_0534 [Paenibacillus pasadenensis]|uniref:Uncharacterized protein n=1 Tax=Paenibacillus pasadenensis TaxID=217090 RepID=A0A2N5NDK8_9BACL|nr:hypothetical protein B8V81_0534 [Paenibacillus pasadenensis]
MIAFGRDCGYGHPLISPLSMYGVRGRSVHPLRRFSYPNGFAVLAGISSGPSART